MLKRILHATCLALTGGAVSIFAGTQAVAQSNNSYPMLMSLKPTAAVVGATTEHELSARYNLAGATAVLISGNGVTGEVFPLETEKPEEKDRNDVMASKCRLKWTCAPDAVPGIRDFRVVTPHGVSTIGQLVVAREPIVSEATENDTIEKAQVISIPATVCGSIEKGEDLDFYRFTIDQPVELTFFMTSQRLQNRLHDMQSRVDPMITLRSESGTTLASSDNVIAGDPLMHYRFDRPGTYVLEVRDVRYQGNADWTYSIEISNRPFPTVVHPLALPPGVSQDVQLIGYGLPPGVRTSIQTPADSAGTVLRIAPVLNGVPLQGVSVFSSPYPIVVETEPAPEGTSTTSDGSIAAPSHPPIQVTLPATIAGRIGSATQVDRYLFAAKANERWSFEVLARRLGSSLDSKLRILNEAQAPLIEMDDTTFDRVTSSDSMIENWTVPADGNYVLEIRDLHGRGGLDFPYAIKVSSSKPYFLLEADTDKTLLAPSTATVLYTRAIRRNGFDGEIQLVAEGLPNGVEAICGRIVPGSNDGAIWLRATPEAQPAFGNIKITGTANVSMPDGAATPLSATATYLQEVYMPGGGRGHYPVEMHTVSIARPMDIRKVQLSTNRIELAPGTSQRIDITIERAPDYKGNVTLDVMLQHLEQPYGNPLPKGVTVDSSQSKTLLSANENSGYITLKAAADAPAVRNHLLPITVHVSINFVMKHTFSGEPLFVSVTPAR
ncbi:MAG: hypothetical protein WCI02_13880 [Planctomycetota bacterium]